MMTTIKELKSQKVPGVTSLFVTLGFYSKEVYEMLIQTPEAVYEKDKQCFEFPVNRLTFLVDLLTQYGEVCVETKQVSKTEWKKLGKHKFKVKPFQHQLDAVEYGLNHEGWMLLDSQGLGKTGTIINLAEILKKTEGLKHCFIVCGVNSLKYNWAKEIEKFSTLDYTILGQKVSRTGKVSFASVSERCKQLKNGLKEFFVITNVETLQDKKFAEAFNKSKSQFDMIVFDEIHHVKSPTTASAKTLLKMKAKRCIALSGTIIMNTPEDVFVPLKWTGNLGATFTQMKRTFNVYGGFGGVQVIGHKNLEVLQELIASCSLRRLKEDVLDLPPKTYQIEYVEMGKAQQQLYDSVQNGIAAELDKLDHKPTIMEEITINMRSRQITAYPGALSSDNEPSAKLDRLEELVQEIVAQGDKVVIFSTFKDTTYEVQRRLKQYGVVLCNGDVSDIDTSANIEKFQKDAETKVFVGTWQKCGTGITLTEASYLIFIDTPWTSADFEQASDRIYRIGQKKPVFIITLITKDTYDERVQEILNTKESLSNYLIDNKGKLKESE